ncbi:hypothetical protein [Rheinheimera sp. WS51]|uniref:hypothetical protein n=1 Tax=Rheinheimera sp. WS51 TaxID=3425886 RepID=UPI003D8D7D7E
MTTFTPSQQQLLKVLQITPLQLNAAYEDSTADCSGLHGPDLTLQLAQDITAALPDSYRWLIRPDAVSSELQQQLLYTPSLKLLQTATQKRALWALLSHTDEN